MFLYYYIDPDGETAPQFKKILKIATNITISEKKIQEFIKKRMKDLTQNISALTLATRIIINEQ